MYERVILTFLVFTIITMADAVLYDTDDDLMRSSGKRVLPGSYLVVNGIESFNDVLWYVPKEPFSVSQLSTTTSSPTTTKSPRNGNLVQRVAARDRQRDLATLDEPSSSYEFGYGIRDSRTSSDFGHEEKRRLDDAQGQYRVLLPDGRLQIVDYRADRRGFRPSVRYKNLRGKAGTLKTFRTY